MEPNIYNTAKCGACVKKRQCRNNIKDNNLCGIHMKVKNITYYIENNIYKCYKITTENITAIILIQSYVRRFLKMYILRIQGSGVLNRTKINNDVDFVTYESIKTLDIENIFTYTDDEMFTYGFDIKSIKILLDTDQPNPYTRNKFTEECRSNFKKLLKILTERKQDLEFKKKLPGDKKSLIKLKCIDVFQKMDSLKLYTQIKWFIDLNLNQLKKLYFEIEDIWNYRAMLNPSQKLNYITNGNAFLIQKSYIKKMLNIERLQTILLNEFNKFLTQGITDEDKTTAAYWILTGLTIVSPDAAYAMPNLVQVFD